MNYSKKFALIIKSDIRFCSPDDSYYAKSNEWCYDYTEILKIKDIFDTEQEAILAAEESECDDFIISTIYTKKP